jgi:hypothetical protein
VASALIQKRAKLITQYDSQGLVKSDVIVAASRTLIELFIVNNSGSTRYFQLFDSATVPADGSVPMMMPITLTTGATASLDLTSGLAVFESGVSTGLRSVNGFSWACSTTLATKTLTGSNEMWVTARYF